MHSGGMRSAMDLFDFEKSANLKHPSVQCTCIQDHTYKLKEQSWSISDDSKCLLLIPSGSTGVTL